MTDSTITMSKTRFSTIKDLMETYRLLADGYCREHPSYRAIYAPRANCPDCDRMWAARERIKELTGVASS